MCLQIYIKEKEKFYLTYIPDAKAITDAPASLAVLLKQRRRWTNGALFGTIKVLKNFANMIDCTRTKHKWYEKLLMTFYMIYSLISFIFQFFIIGSMYASVSIFLKQELDSLALITDESGQ